MEAITNIRTVAGLRSEKYLNDNFLNVNRCEAKMLKLYQSELVKPFKSGELILNQV